MMMMMRTRIRRQMIPAVVIERQTLVGLMVKAVWVSHVRYV
jgi:hypothetical protein